MKEHLDKIKEFKPASWAIDNKISIFVMTIILMLWGLMSYLGLPKESFPEIVIPKIFVSTIYPGTSPTNMENLVTKPIEKRMKSIAGVKKITSNSYQDYSVITVEFNTDTDIKDAKQKVKDEIDQAARDLPQDLPQQPQAMDVNLSELPIMFVNISGNFDLKKLKEYAEDMQDRIESLKEITKVDITGALDREIQINVDMYKMQAAQLSLGDIERTIGFENLTMSGGSVPMDGMRRTINIKGEFKTVEELQNQIIKSPTGAPIYLKDIAEVKDAFKEQESYARLNGKNVITLAVKKRAGENLIEASDKIRDIVTEMKKTDFPEGLDIVITGDQADHTRTTLHDLINTIIIGFILVTVILMFFMGATNSFFVALSVPLSMCVAFIVMTMFGMSMNMIVLFAFLLALGIVVDDAIVVIENTHRIFDNGKVPIVKAAKAAAGEVFLPVLSGTLTTLAPFIPLLFWEGVIGEFMKFMPLTLIITLLASLLVAYVINPVFAVATMKPHDDHETKTWSKGSKLTMVLLTILALIFYITALIKGMAGADYHGAFGWGNFVLTIMLLFALYKYFLKGSIKKFQTSTWPRMQDRYVRVLKWALKRPKTMLFGTVGLFFISIIAMMATGVNVVFFPKGDPNFVYVYINLPVGTDQAETDRVTQMVEKKVYKVLDMDNGKKNPLVKSVISNVTQNVTDPQDEDQGVYPNRSKIAISFVQFADREGASTSEYLNKIREAVQGTVPGAEVSVNQEQAGPPVPKPISIEIAGDDLQELVKTSDKVQRYLDSLKIGGVEELRSDFQANKPEIVFDIDRERANREGIAVGQIAMEIRKAVFGLDNASKFREENDEYPIQLRYAYNQRTNIEALKNMKITYRDMSMGGMIRNVPLSAFVDIRYENSYGGIKRKNQKRVITLSSNVLNGFNPNAVVGNIQTSLNSFKSPDSVQIRMAGEQEEQKETGTFLGNALLMSLALIFIILVTQFNSLSKPIIILTEILFSIIGVLLGVTIFRMDMSVVMSGVGIIALAGIVVRNGILLVEFTDLMKQQGMSTYDAIVEAGRTRMTPVILTATATILGLIPLAVGFNIDFETMFTHLNPHIYFGGDSVAFWGPLSWTMIFGLSFATFLTLVLVPAMYLLADRAKERNKRILNHLGLSEALMYIPLVVPVCRIFVPKHVIKGDTVVSHRV
jgi:multidrug efflux pump subunit AcrB